MVCACTEDMNIFGENYYNLERRPSVRVKVPPSEIPRKAFGVLTNLFCRPEPLLIELVCCCRAFLFFLMFL